MRVLGLIPARGGSRRIVRKNLALLGGKTLVRRALETALEARCFGLVVLSSEDPEILAEAEGLDVVRIERPPELASDTALAYDVVMQALAAVEAGREAFDAVGIVQCTSPFTAPADLKGVVDLLAASGAGSAVTVSRLESALHPLKLKRLEGDRLLPLFADDEMTPSHELQPVWVRNGSAYVTRREVLEGGRLIADDVRGYEMPAERSLDIDTPRDLALARLIAGEVAS
jgi:CMP-N,N'-diacetyllegionaminic acid synthase